MRTISFIAICLALTSCEMQKRIMEDGGTIGAEPSSHYGADYVVRIQNKIDFGFNPDDKLNRHKWATSYLSKQCAAPHVVDEKVIETGVYPLAGRKSRTYYVYVSCS